MPSGWLSVPTVLVAPRDAGVVERSMGVTVLSVLAVKARSPEGVMAIPTGPSATAIGVSARGGPARSTGVTCVPFAT